jgi:hypothetical protein
MSEAELQKNIAIYLRANFPEVIFHSDFGSGAKLSYKQAMTQKIQNGGRRAWPDLFIAEPRPDGRAWHHGLFIELKKEGTRLKKKNGEWASLHIEEQAEVLDELAKRGYRAVFGVGYEETLQIIDDYLD